ncbi:MAG: uracil-DNA glycosylase family protein [Lachnospiraceae bacterium]|nr:uracil-DNA glycosylase family protein [Lachnospiraceae bacterium]
MQEFQNIAHTFEPIYNKESEILILGSFPSVKSRENNFYYGHPQNRFWKVLGKVFGENTQNTSFYVNDSVIDKSISNKNLNDIFYVPQTIEEKKEFLLTNYIAIWDVIASCTISGSSDTSIRDVVVNDFTEILKNSNISKIYVNGGKAYELYRKYAEQKTGIKAIKLPSTSPANAAWNLDRLYEAWKIIKE